MALVNTTLPQTNDTVNVVLPIHPLPDGTIFMFTTWDRLDDHYAGNPSFHPSPSRYFLSQADALKAAILKSWPDPEYVGVTGNGYCTIWETTDIWGEQVYIYVWAVPPMGGAA